MNPNGMASFTGLSHAIGRQRRSSDRGPLCPPFLFTEDFSGSVAGPPAGTFCGQFHHPSAIITVVVKHDNSY